MKNSLRLRLLFVSMLLVVGFGFSEKEPTLTDQTAQVEVVNDIPVLFAQVGAAAPTQEQKEIPPETNKQLIRGMQGELGGESYVLFAQAELNEEDTSPEKEQLSEDPEEPEDSGGILGWIGKNFGEIILFLLGLGELLGRIIPSVNKKAWFMWLIQFLDFLLPKDNKAGGGTHS